MPFYVFNDPAAEWEDKNAKEVKNKFKWAWLEDFGEWCRKSKKPGFVFCAPCNQELKYSNRGKYQLQCHAKQDKHKKAIEVSSCFLSDFQLLILNDLNELKNIQSNNNKKLNS